MKYYDDKNYTTSSTGSMGSITLTDLLAGFEKIKALGPPPPRPDPFQCVNCKEEMSRPAIAVYSEGFPYGPASAYLCGRCAVLIKREYFYKPRQRELEKARGND